jgi:hypothetical protein
MRFSSARRKPSRRRALGNAAIRPIPRRDSSLDRRLAVQDDVEGVGCASRLDDLPGRESNGLMISGFERSAPFQGLEQRAGFQSRSDPRAVPVLGHRSMTKSSTGDAKRRRKAGTRLCVIKKEDNNWIPGWEGKKGVPNWNNRRNSRSGRIFYGGWWKKGPGRRSGPKRIGRDRPVTMSKTPIEPVSPPAR